ncbi:hypothetical protein ACFVDI_00750 [Nocardioides sp. NPDC057767]|mgnify:CR=1 FL=1|uniref:hypothetical protein n=1 Tax=unclassified Nocardioides TaxID=2615069 RepID=UPI0033227563
MTLPDPDELLTREDEDDHDLLTYGEAGVRLQEAVRAQRDLVKGLADEGSSELAVARARLGELEEAAARNARQPINDENFERFFGYRGKAVRNT